MIKTTILLLLTLILYACNAQEPEARSPSAAKNVTVIEKPFVIKGLNRERKIRVYLPPGYDSSTKKYAVLYMHDGQNLFDDVTSYVGEWEVDETLNDLSERSNLNLIVVGIDNGQGKRMTEMAPWDHERFGKAEGDEYVDFIVNQIKPYIDSTYRALLDRKNTAIMGSSMGGLISHYAIHKHPEVFSKAGIFSPSYWFSGEIFTYTKDNPVPIDTKFYVNVGSKEGSDMEKPAKQMVDLISKSGHPESNLHFENVKGGHHGESFWAAEFGEAVLWLFDPLSE